jgi:hypothetical protein
MSADTAAASDDDDDDDATSPLQKRITRCQLAIKDQTEPNLFGNGRGHDGDSDQRGFVECGHL